MDKSLIYYIILGIVILVFLTTMFFYLSIFDNSINLISESFVQNVLKTTPSLSEIMAIIKKSPDYPDFLKIIKSNDFDAELVDYYNFSPEMYNKKIGEWEINGDSMKELKQVFQTIQLNENSYLVQLKSKLNPKQGLLAIIDMAKKQPQAIVVELKIEAGVGI